MPASALSFVGPRRVEWTNVELPPLSDDELRARTLYSGISSGTELLAYRGELDPSMPVDEELQALSGTFDYPFRYGYSCVGRVEESTIDLPIGALVFAFHPHQDRFIAPVRDVVVVDGVAPRLATLFPLVETAFQVSLDAGAVSEQVVVVLGLGAVGLLTSVLLRRAGARPIAADPLEWRRSAALHCGIEAIDPSGLPEVVERETDGQGAAVVVEVSGNPAALERSLGLLAHEGTALVASWYGTKPVQLPLGREFHRRRLVIRSTQVSTIPARLGARWTLARRRRVVARLLRELPLDVIATHEFPHRDAAAAYRALDRAEPGLIHAALSYG